MKIAAVILAAGSSSRMKTSKQLLVYKGKSLLQNAIDQVASLPVDARVLVTGAQHEVICRRINSQGFEILPNTAHQEGMSASIRTAIHFLSTQNMDAVLLLLCDQPLIPLAHYAQLIARAKESAALIISTAYQNTLGVPTIFRAELFEELANLNKQQGAKKLVYKLENQAIRVPCEAAAFDVDTPEDYERLLRQ